MVRALHGSDALRVTLHTDHAVLDALPMVLAELATRYGATSYRESFGFLDDFRALVRSDSRVARLDDEVRRRLGSPHDRTLSIGAPQPLDVLSDEDVASFVVSGDGRSSEHHDLSVDEVRTRRAGRRGGPYRTTVQRSFQDRWPGHSVPDRPTVVFAVGVDSEREGPLHSLLPVFARVSLRDHVDEVRSRYADVALARITVHRTLDPPPFPRVPEQRWSRTCHRSCRTGGRSRPDSASRAAARLSRDSDRQRTEGAAAPARRVILGCMKFRVGAKGQVVIPKPLRDQLGIEPGDEVEFWTDGDHVAVRPVSLRRPLRGRFAGDGLTDALERQRAAGRVREDS